MLISDFAIRRPVVTIVSMVALVVFGLIASYKLKTDEFPDVQAPFVSVGVVYPGGSPDGVEREVLEPIEEAVASISGVKKITGYAQDGFAQLIIEFQFEKPLAEATQDIRDGISAIRSDLPDEIEEPIIKKLSDTDRPIVSLALASTSLTAPELTRLADPGIARELRSLPGVAEVTVVGKQERELTVLLRPEALQANGVSVLQVVQALRLQNLASPVGRVEADFSEQSIRLTGRLAEPQDFLRLVVAERNGRLIRLGEVASAVDGTEEPRSLALFNDREAVGIDIKKAKGYSTTDVSGRILARVTSIQKTLPAGAELKMVKNGGERVDRSVRNVEETLVEGALLTVLVVFLFLNSWRSTVITGLALPVSVLASFIAVWAFGFTLNTMSLLGLSLAIGILIDDAIVVRENIVRHVEMGKDHITAAREGTDEIGLAVAATTFSILSVFVPIAFLPGVAGQWFKPFGLTIACSVAVSLFVSFSLDPMLSAYWPDPHRAEHQKSWITRQLDRFNAWFTRLAQTYRRVIGWALDHRVAVVIVATGSFLGALVLPVKGLTGLGVVAIAVAVAVWLVTRRPNLVLSAIGTGATALLAVGCVTLAARTALTSGAGLDAVFLVLAQAGLGVLFGWIVAKRVPKLLAGERPAWASVWGGTVVGIVLAGSLLPAVPAWHTVGTNFFPLDDRGEFNVKIETPPGSNLRYSRLKSEEVVRLLRSTPEVRYTYVTLGGGSSGAVDEGNLYVRLVPREQRALSVEEFAARLRQQTNRMTGVKLSVFTSDFGGGRKQVQLEVRGHSVPAITAVADQVRDIVAQVPGVVDLGLSSKGQKPELNIGLNRALAGSLGITVGDVAQAVRPAFAGLDAGDWVDPSGETRDVEIRLAPGSRTRPEDLARLPLMVLGRNGAPAVLPLGQVADITSSVGPAVINHLDRDPVVIVEANVSGRPGGAVSADIAARLAKLTLPPGVRITTGGDAEQQSEVFGNIFIALGVAAMLMYLILVMQFGSFMDPLAIMMSLPLSMIGVMLGLAITGLTINIMSLIGVILLMGIVAKNAILLIDFAKWARERQGIPIREALIEAGAIRLRPILMTTFALIAGMLPVALGRGEGAQFRQPLGVSVIGGVITSTLLTLVAIPTFYEILDGFRGVLQGLARRFFGAEAYDTVVQGVTGEHRIGP
jgi:HAE1 family hydrophobic/amphiphilic exporter-1